MNRRLLLHFGYWALYLLLLAFMLAIARLQAVNVLFTRVGLLLIAPNVLAFYFAWWRLFAPRISPRSIAAAVVAAIAFPSLALLAFGLRPAKTSELAVLLACLSALALIHMTIAFVLRGFVAWVDERTLKDELRLKLVRARLDPHFLFNTLSNLDVLVLRDPAAASLYLNKLSELLRFVLYEAQAERIPLKAELAYLEKYIDLQRIRGKSVSFRKVEAELAIAPMLLIPFVENAFKHAAGREEIAIETAVDGGRLSFVCANRYEAGPAGGGLGNDLMRRRLALLYPGQHTLELEGRDGIYTARLTLELK